MINAPPLSILVASTSSWYRRSRPKKLRYEAASRPIISTSANTCGKKTKPVLTGWFKVDGCKWIVPVAHNLSKLVVLE